MCWRGPASVSLLVVPGMQFRRRRLGKKRNVCIDQDIEPPNLGFAICSAARDWRRVLVSPPVRVHGVSGPEMNRWKDFFFSTRCPKRPSSGKCILPLSQSPPDSGERSNRTDRTRTARGWCECKQKNYSAIQANPSLALCLARRFWVLILYFLSSQSLWLSLMPAATAANRCFFARSLRT